MPFEGPVTTETLPLSLFMTILLYSSAFEHQFLPWPRSGHSRFAIELVEMAIEWACGPQIVEDLCAVNLLGSHTADVYDCGRQHPEAWSGEVNPNTLPNPGKDGG